MNTWWKGEKFLQDPSKHIPQLHKFLGIHIYNKHACKKIGISKWVVVLVNELTKDSIFYKPCIVQEDRKAENGEQWSVVWSVCVCVNCKSGLVEEDEEEDFEKKLKGGLPLKTLRSRMRAGFKEHGTNESFRYTSTLYTIVFVARNTVCFIINYSKYSIICIK